MGEVNNFLIYAGKSSRDFGVWISGSGTFDAPDRDVTTVSVPGRNGDLTMDNGHFKNITMTYPAFIPRDFKENMAAFRAYMKSFTGYQRLEDTYHPEFYYMAMLNGGFDPDTSPYNRAAEFEISFNRKPQRWLKSGENFMVFGNSTVLTQNTTIVNPTSFPANPLIRVRGTGTFTIGAISVEVNENTVYTDIDCDLQDCHYGLNNLNANVVMVSGRFPTLPAGTTGINIGTVTSLEIMPRWWTI